MDVNLVSSMIDDPALASGSRGVAKAGVVTRSIFLRLAIIFALAFVVRLAVISQTSVPPTNDLLWNDAVGWNLAQGHGFSASQAEPYVPGVFRTPGYPAFLALVYYFFGHSYEIAFGFQAMLDTLSAVLITLIGIKLMSLRVALTAGFLYAAYPYSAFFCGVLSQDILLTFIVLVALYLTTRVDLVRPRLFQWLLIGLAFGIAALVKSFIALLVLVPALVVIVAVRGMRTRIAALAMLGLGVALMISPWVVRNYVLFRSFPPLAVGGTGTDMALSLEELESGEDALIKKIAAPDFNAAASAKYLDGFVDGADLIAQEKALFQKSYPEILRRWPQYLLVTVRHIPRLWLTQYVIGHGHGFTMVAVALSWVYLIPGILGMLLLRKEWRRLVILFGGIIVITLIYAPHLVEARYTLPARPMLMLFVATTVCVVLERFRLLVFRRSNGQPQAEQEVVGVSTSV